MNELTNIATNRNIFNQMPEGHETNKKLGRPKILTHRNPNFGVSLRNDPPVILYPPKGYIPMTDERFKYLISMQTQWRHEYLKQKPTITNYALNKEWFKEYNRNYRQEKKLSALRI